MGERLGRSTFDLPEKLSLSLAPLKGSSCCGGGCQGCGCRDFLFPYGFFFPPVPSFASENPQPDMAINRICKREAFFFSHTISPIGFFLVLERNISWLYLGYLAGHLKLREIRINDCIVF